MRVQVRGITARIETAYFIIILAQAPSHNKALLESSFVRLVPVSPIKAPVLPEKEVFGLQEATYITVLSNGTKLVLNTGTSLYVLMIERNATLWTGSSDTATPRWQSRKKLRWSG